MGRTLSTFISNLQTKAQDPNLTAATAVIYLNDAILDVKADYRIRSAIRRETIKIYKDVNEYPLPIPSGATETDFESICDLTEWFEGTASASRFNRVTPSRFARKMDVGYQDNYITPFIRNGQNMLLVDYDPGTSNVTVEACDDLTTNGSWAASGDANNLTADDQTYLEGGGALNFDITPSTLTATLTNSTLAAVDLTDYENNASLFLYAYLPSATNITSLALRWGSDSSNYWSKTVTTQHNGLAFQDGWNLLSFDWNAATKTASPTVSAINYLQANMVMNASQVADTDFRIDGIVARQSKDMYFLYDSSSWVKTSAGAVKNAFIATDDTYEFVGTETEAALVEIKALQLIYVYEIVDDLKAANSEKRYQEMLRNLKSRNPEISKNQSFIYTKIGFL